MTTEEKRLAKNKYLREWRAKNSDRLNKQRRDKYSIAKSTGLSTLESQNFRGLGVKTITNKYSNIKYKEDSKVFSIFKTRPKKIKEVIIKDIPVVKKVVSKRTERRRIARDLGYTPAEADYLREVSEDKWDDIISNMVVVDSSGRENRWAMMASKDRYDNNIIESCEAINIEEGYDINSRYGWAVYYFWYLHGGELDHWKSYCKPDIFNTDILGYNGNAGTYLTRIGIEADKNLKKYEKTLPVKIKYTRKGHAKLKDTSKSKGTTRNYKNVNKDKKQPYTRNRSKVS